MLNHLSSYFEIQLLWFWQSVSEFVKTCSIGPVEIYTLKNVNVLEHPLSNSGVPHVFVDFLALIYICVCFILLYYFIILHLINCSFNRYRGVVDKTIFFQSTLAKTHSQSKKKRIRFKLLNLVILFSISLLSHNLRKISTVFSRNRQNISLSQNSNKTNKSNIQDHRIFKSCFFIIYEIRNRPQTLICQLWLAVVGNAQICFKSQHIEHSQVFYYYISHTSGCLIDDACFFYVDAKDSFVNTNKYHVSLVSTK